jgi:antitoxin HicB
MLAYPIEIERDGDYFVGTLVDFPESNPVGRTENELLIDARNSLEEMLMARMEDREEIPLPSPAKGRRVILVPLLVASKITLYSLMRERGLRKADLARLLKVNQKQVDRLLDLNHQTRMDQFEAAFRALGMVVDLQVKDAAQVKGIIAA